MAIRGVQTKKVTELEAGTAIEDSHVIPVHDGTSLKGVPFSVIRNATGGGTGGGGGTGADGFSPVANVTKDGTVSTITITDKTGTTTVQVMDGEPGAPGIPGEKGETGATGATGPRGEQGVAGQDGKNFAISKIYDTSDDMLTDTIPLPDGVFVAVVSPKVNVYMRSRDTVAGGNDLAGYKFVLNLEEASVLRGEPGPQGPTGANGADGKDGTTPIKGIDYFTDADKQAFINDIKKPLADGKKLVADAISAKGVTTAADADFAVMAANIDAIACGAEPDYSIVAENLANWGYRPDPVNSNTINDKVNEMYEATGTYLADIYNACTVSGILPNSNRLPDVKERVEDMSALLNAKESGTWMTNGTSRYIYGGTVFKFNGNTYATAPVTSGNSVTNEIYRIEPNDRFYLDGTMPKSGLQKPNMFQFKNYVYIIGGYSRPANASTTAVYRSTDLKTWEKISDVPKAFVANHSYIILGDTIYIYATDSIYKSEDEGVTWTKVGNLNVASKDPYMCTINGVHYCVGIGSTSKDVYSSTDMTTWTKIGTLPMSVYCAGIEIVDKTAYIFGGLANNIALSTCYASEDFTSWRKMPDLKYKTYGPVSYAMNDTIYCVGGYNVSTINPTQSLSLTDISAFFTTKKEYQTSLYNAIVAKGATPASHTVEDLIAAINTL